MSHTSVYWSKPNSLDSKRTSLFVLHFPFSIRNKHLLQCEAEIVIWNVITQSTIYHYCILRQTTASFHHDRCRYISASTHYTARNLAIASIVAFAFDKRVCASGTNTELLYTGVSDIEPIALVTGTYPSPP